MNNNQYTYQPPMGQGMPPQIGAPRQGGWRERWMRNFGMDWHSLNRNNEFTIPHWLTGKAIAFFFMAMIVCWGSFGYVPAFNLVLVACISTLLFFYGGSTMANSWSQVKERNFIRYIFITGFVLRILWVLYCYFVFNPDHFGNNYGETADVDWYVPFGQDIARSLAGDSKYSFFEVLDNYMASTDDMGYPTWLGLIYLIFGKDANVFIILLLKCVLSAYCTISMYHVAKRHFGDGVARIAAIFVCLNPNMIYWCGTMFKEAEMVFLVCLAVDNFDRVLSSGKRYSFRALLPGILSGLALFFFRLPLAVVIFLAVFAHIVMASGRVMSFGKKIIAGLLVGGTLLLSVGDKIQSQSRELMEAAQSDKQQTNMEWRGERKGGNSFARYAGAAVFAPLIFTIPFPTFNQANEYQLLQIQLSGGSFIKNIFSYFVILVFLMMLISGEWRRHVFILAYTVGYHLVLVMSNFAQSGRFHMPVWPMLMLFAAYGIQIAKTNTRVRKWFPIVLVIEVAACLVWNWFKLKGRGMI